MTASTTASGNPEWFLDDPALVIALVHWAMSKGAVITREWLGLPPAEPVPARPATAAQHEARWLREIRDIAAGRDVTDAEAGGRIRALLFPACIHDDDGTVEGCPGCFPPGEAIGREELHRADQAAALDDDLEDGQSCNRAGDLFQVFQHFIDGQAPASARTAEFTVDGAGFYAITPGQRRILLAIAPPAIRSLNNDLDDDLETFRTSGTWPAVPCGSQVPEMLPWPDLTRDWDVAEICAALRVVDAHLDANTAQAYRDQPLAGHMSRIGKAQSEAREAMEALSGVTGENPRKGVCDTWEHVMEELGDTACAGLLGIQHITKDTDVTWAVFIAALAKTLRRVPGARPAPSATTEGDPS